MFGKNTDKPEPKITDVLSSLDSSVALDLPVLQYGIANFVAIARVEVGGKVKFALVAIPFVGKPCNTLLDTVNLKDVLNLDNRPADPAAA